MRYFKALLLTEGAHGMVSQVEGLAKALKLDFNHCFVNLWDLIHALLILLYLLRSEYFFIESMLTSSFDKKYCLLNVKV